MLRRKAVTQAEITVGENQHVGILEECLKCCWNGLSLVLTLPHQNLSSFQ